MEIPNTVAEILQIPQNNNAKIFPIERNTIHQLGFWSALIAFFAASGYCISQLLQVAGIIIFPMDSILIFGFSMGIAIPYVIAVVAVHYTIASEKKIWSHLAIVFAVMYSVYVNLNYIVQLTTVIPRSIEGTVDAIRILDQTPHSLFWDVDGIGYICMGISTFFLAFAFSNNPSEKWLKKFLIANGVTTPLVTVVYFYPYFSIPLLFLASPWMITAPGCLLMLSIFFRNKKSKSRFELQ